MILLRKTMAPTITLEELQLYFYIACGIAVLLFVIILFLICGLNVKINRKVSYRSLDHLRSNQISRQTHMMADFCYTNPMIIPGEELARRGFSMYNGAETNVDQEPIPMQHHTVRSHRFSSAPTPTETLSKF
ncbi:hypothetical protein TKK_0011139 [Trichogramma kaykai]